MKIRAGAKLCGKKPRQVPPRAALSSTGAAHHVGLANDREVIGEYEERERCDRGDTGGQPVEPIDEVDRVDGEHCDQNGDGNADIPAEHQRPGVAPGT